MMMEFSLRVVFHAFEKGNEDIFFLFEVNLIFEVVFLVRLIRMVECRIGIISKNVEVEKRLYMNYQ